MEENNQMGLEASRLREVRCSRRTIKKCRQSADAPGQYLAEVVVGFHGVSV